MKGEEYAEHDTEKTQSRRRMRIESGIQVARHVPTIRRDLLSAALIGQATTFRPSDPVVADANVFQLVSMG